MTSGDTPDGSPGPAGSAAGSTADSEQPESSAAIPTQPTPLAFEAPAPTPAAALPPAQYPPAQYPPAQYPPAQYPPMSAPPMAYPPMSAPPSPYPPMVFPPGAYPAQYAVPMSAPPYGLPGYPWLPPPTKPRASTATRMTVLILSVAIVASVLGVGVLFGYSTLSRPSAATWQTGAPGDPPPTEDAPATLWLQWARRSVDDAVKDQASALLAGNEDAFEGVGDPTNTKLVADLKRRYTTLRAMKPGVWTEVLTGGLKSSTSRSWTGDIKITYCFGEATCVSSQVTESSRWEFKNDRLVMVSLGTTSPSENGPRPWETDDLTVAQGTRVVVATTKSNTWRLADAVKAADKAALVADMFAKWTPAPNRYVVFLAGPADWARWYGHDQPDWAAAWAVPVSNTVTEVVVRTEVVQQRGLETLLTHELTHVTSLAGKRDGATSGAWWLIEGIAEYATMLNKSINNYDGFEPTRAYVRGKWDGQPNVPPPGNSAGLDEASARYGIAFLSVRRIAEKYGQDKMLDFFGRVVHDNQDQDAAAQAALGAPWATVSADCASFVRRSVG